MIAKEFNNGVAKEFSNSSAPTNLNQTKLFVMLELPKKA